MVYFLVCVHSCKTKVNYSSRMPPEMSALLVIKWTTEIVRLWGWVTIQNLSWLFKNDIIALISFRLNSGRWIAYDERHDLQDSLPSCMRYSEKQFHRKTVEISWITERKKITSAYRTSECHIYWSIELPLPRRTIVLEYCWRWCQTTYAIKWPDESLPRIIYIIIFMKYVFFNG